MGAARMGEYWTDEDFDRPVVLLGWNRDDHDDVWPGWVDDLQQVLDGYVVEGSWSVGRHRNIERGTLCVLVTQGTRHPRGVVGLGEVMSEPYEAEHYTGTGTTNYVDVQWHELLPLEDGIPVETLDREVRGGPWLKGFRQNGTRLAPDVSRRLLEFWFERWSPVSEEPGPGELAPGERREGAVRTIWVNRYERDPVARAQALEHHGRRCAVCALDPVDVYGPEIGERLLHVHHIVPLSTIGKEYQVDPVTDLVPLCPNCHNAVHKRDPVLTPAELTALLTSSGGEPMPFDCTDPRADEGFFSGPLEDALEAWIKRRGLEEVYARIAARVAEDLAKRPKVRRGHPKARPAT